MLPKGARVRFTEDALSSMPDVDAKRLRGREGVVAGYRMGAVEPIVSFDADGRRKALRLFEVGQHRLEVVGEPSPALVATRFSSVPLLGFFKEAADSPTWYMKRSARRAVYQADGVRGEPSFEPNETVWVEEPNPNKES